MATEESKPQREELEVELWHAAASRLPLGIVLVDPEGITRYNDVKAKFGNDGLNQRILVERAVANVIAESAHQPNCEETVELFGPPRRTFVARCTQLVGGARLVTVEDVTALRRLESVRRDFVANVSHELKTPVGAIVLLAEALASEEDPETARRLVERIASESDRLARLVTDLLDLSRIEEGRGPVITKVDLAAVLTTLAEHYEELARRAGLSLHLELPAGPAVLEADRWQLESALGNLIDNAIKYSEPGGCINLGVAVDATTLTLWVRDQGIGIPARDRDRIFERFYRVDAARSRATGGTGLGLSIVRHVVENHRGRLELTSKEGEGSEFRLILPREQPRDGS